MFCKQQNKWGHTNGGVVDVVVGSNHAQVQRRNIHVIFYTDALQQCTKIDSDYSSPLKQNNNKNIKNLSVMKLTVLTTKYSLTKWTKLPYTLHEKETHLGLFKVADGVFHQLRQVVRQVTMGHTCQHRTMRDLPVASVQT
jgi:hypothetical protein